MNDEFYIGYLPKAPLFLGRFTRNVVIAFAVIALGIAAILAATLPYFGTGEFDFGNPREYTGTVRCEMGPRLIAADGTEYLLVGYGKNRVAPEICGANGSEVTLRGTLIQREGKQLLETITPPKLGGAGSTAPQSIPLGRFTLTGEIVDSKCYFGVMNPAEGRMHRACAVLCLKGGVPAVFVARDQTGATVHLLITGPDGQPMNDQLLRWVGEGVKATGDIIRQGKWLVWHLDPKTLHPSSY